MHTLTNTIFTLGMIVGLLLLVDPLINSTAWVLVHIWGTL